MSGGETRLNVPEGWSLLQLKDVCTKITDGTHKTPEYRPKGVRFISIKNIRPFQPINWGSYEKYISREAHAELTKRCNPEFDDILFPRIGTLGFAKRIDFDNEVSLFVGLGLLKPRRNLVRPKFLELWMNTPLIRRLSHQRANGSGRLTLPLEETRLFPVLLPKLEVQDRIIEETEKQFTRLDAGVAALRRVQANLKRYRAAVLKAACEGRLVPTEAELAKAEGRTYETGEQLLARILADRRKNWHGRGKYKEPAVPDTTNLPLLPEGWTWVTMPQLGELARGKSKHRPRDDAKLYGGPYPFIQTGDVRKSNGTVCDYTQTYSEFGLQQSRLWPAGTLCITIAANIAETGILNFDACFPDSVVGFVQDMGPSTTRYLEFFVRTAREKLEQFAPATAQKNINLEVLQKVAIPLPPLAEQARIVAEVERRLSIIEELEAAVAANLQRATRLRQSVLRRAFE